MEPAGITEFSLWKLEVAIDKHLLIYPLQFALVLVQVMNTFKNEEGACSVSKSTLSMLRITISILED
eukprot:snap_masked-scaffold_23-processed-gene-3.15-mRNA-1 protein AED:1.00 eAED:1.00 QI:0/0/0/0/1/1/2/0/66